MTMQPIETPATAIIPGFSNPVIQSQTAFRTIMSALAEPGRWLPLIDTLTPPESLPLPAALALLTLADFDTPLWLPDPWRSGAAGAWLRFHCGCPLTASTADAAFAVIDPNDPTSPRISDFSFGDDRFPDRSATLLVFCGSDDKGFPVDLSGPGIATTVRIAPNNLTPQFWLDAIANAKLYPQGVDLLLVSATHIMGLPRSTRIDGVA
jgi:alpha-D-ribose 1-methylphosphonate 5-triphosphate synthase subunit PhnH